MLTLRDVCKSYDAEIVLGPLDLSLPPRRRTLLVGPSGSGKSTLLRLCAGLIAPDAGQLLVAGEPLRRADLTAFRRRLGYVIQEGGLFPHLRAARNVTLVARELGWSASRRRERVGELAELVQLPPALLDRYPHELSGGQRQRVALMRALMLGPELLLLDEPLGALDPLTRRRLQDELLALLERLRCTVLMVTHDLGEAVHLGEHLVVLHQGRIAQADTPAAVLARPAAGFVADFVTAALPRRLPAS